MLATGYTLGGNAGVSIEYYPVKWISVGANAGIFSATFYKFNVSNNQSSTTVDLEAKDFENISRMDYSLGVRFHF
ncbi:hypothetical protein FACS189426_15780 [Bacteroidia bacterium]|nr:hypothetical protein FACS189426_15780 [Bacteroidia bacterium]GHT86479.1 hypothetical protein FACS18947_6350 [Bacteroidia bacterium]